MSVCIVTLWFMHESKIFDYFLISSILETPKLPFESTNKNGPAAILTTNLQTVFYTRDVFPVVFCHI